LEEEEPFPSVSMNLWNIAKFVKKAYEITPWNQWDLETLAYSDLGRLRPKIWPRHQGRLVLGTFLCSHNIKVLTKLALTWHSYQVCGVYIGD
jgi:hypothetical protein